MMLGNLWVIPALCLAGAVGNLALGSVKARKVFVNLVGLGSVGAACAVGWIAIWEYQQTQTGPGRAVVEKYFTWIRFDTFEIGFSFQMDPLAAVMLAFVTSVGFLIHLYSVGYMAGETKAGYARYFAYLNLFMFSMLLLSLGSNLAVLFIGWEGVGLCSYLLIGFYFEKTFCADAGKKAFIVNRIGDVGFLLAIFLILDNFGTLEFTELAARMQIFDSTMLSTGLITAIALLLFVGATGKSAQIPLHVWLPDAMAGPTPVSALIHAATMVTAGVYMAVRCNFFFHFSPTASLAVAVVGAVTALMAAAIALVQNDIKKILAYSTVSQLGYMFLAIGSGAFVAAIFHVVMHAFFKACLFLGSGSVIHACDGEQDLRRMGGLKKHLPTTYWTFLMAAAALAGFPLMAGFVSKDGILAKVFAAGAHGLNGYGRVYYLLWGLGLFAAVLTAFYIFRLVYLVFHHSYRGGEESESELHESPWTMTVPLQVLGILSVVGGLLVGFPGALFHLEGWSFIDVFLAPVLTVPESHGLDLGLEWLLVILSVGAAFAGILTARHWYLTDPAGARPRAFAEKFAGIYTILSKKFLFDEIYDWTLVRSIRATALQTWKIVDVLVIDTILVNGAAFVVHLAGDALRFLQTGYVRHYALTLALGVLAIAAVLW